MIPLGLSLLSLDLSVLPSVLPSFSGSPFDKVALDLCCLFLLAPVHILEVHSDWTSLVTCPLRLGDLLLLWDLDDVLYPYC